ncbi:MAG: 2-amino-4-hydroxy-6-hydroxymethyldihydropteridine diphosphokinase [Anaerolineae bacterium]|nr:2-amino-4-hydroxy-6-hydroxymethyldihydropteridine diphosphokinase [Anaerolineae bacterium]
MHRVVLLLGSNIDKEHNLPRALALLDELTTVIAVSSIYESAPQGLKEQPSFFNAAVTIETELTAFQIKQSLIDTIERELRRVRTADKNAPRTIDLDIVLYDDAVFTYSGADGRLRFVPDPDLERFVHVAVPVAELLPDSVHPVTGQSLAELAETLLAAAAQAGEPPLHKRVEFDLAERQR